MTPTNHSLGDAAEKFVLTHLWASGIKIIGNRFKTKFGEIDIIAEHHDEKTHETTIVFIEVKYSHNLESALYALQNKQKHRIIEAASLWIAEHSMQAHSYRFDAAIVHTHDKIMHIINGWEMCDSQLNAW